MKERCRFYILYILILSILLIIGTVLSGCISEEEKLKASLESTYQLRSGQDISSIIIDGYIDENEWDEFKWFESQASGLTVYLTNDDDYIYIAIDEKRNISDDGQQENASICFLPPGDSNKIEVGKFKSLKIIGTGRVFWQSWDRLIKEEDYPGVGADDAYILNSHDEFTGTDDRGLYYIIAHNISQIPEGLLAKTHFNRSRTYEARVPLTIINVGPDMNLRVFGEVFGGPTPEEIYYPNSIMGRLAHGRGASFSYKPKEEDFQYMRQLEEKNSVIKYDDGTSEGSSSVGRSNGFLVHFYPSEVPFVIQQIQLFAGLQGSEYDDQFTRIYM
ncbi:MAG: hypothetical protein WC369_04475 [Dehalococcoidales bacterium]|jgi:hypothetical protein